MLAAVRAGQGKDKMPPDLWRWRMAVHPSLAEIDDLEYDKVYRGMILDSVYNAMKAWTKHGSSNAEALTGYLWLKDMGLVG